MWTSCARALRRVSLGPHRPPAGHPPRPLQQIALGLNLPSRASSVTPSYGLGCQGRVLVRIGAGAVPGPGLLGCVWGCAELLPSGRLRVG